MVDAKGVLAKGGMGVLMIEGLHFQFLLVLAALLLGSGRSRWFEGVIIQVPGRRWKPILGGAGVKLV
jgi:hypothetical protein